MLDMGIMAIYYSFINQQEKKVNSEVFSAVLKSHWRAANRALQNARYDSSNEKYWQGRKELARDMHLDLFDIDLNRSSLEEVE